MTENTTLSLTQDELKSLMLVGAMFMEQATPILERMSQTQDINFKFVETCAEIALVLTKVNQHYKGAVETEIAELNALFNLPSVDPSVNPSDDDDSAANGELE